MTPAKRCNRCKEEKPLSEYYRRLEAPDGLQYVCKACKNAYRRISQQRNVERDAPKAKPAPKKCPSCAETKEPSEFYTDKRNRDWLSNYCRMCLRSISRQQYRKHKGKRLQKQKEWRERNPAKVQEYVERHRAKKLGVEYDFTAGQWRDILEQFGYRCVYCLEERDDLEIDHVVPLERGGAHKASNIVPACRSCNSSKNDDSLLIFFRRRVIDADLAVAA